MYPCVHVCLFARSFVCLLACLRVCAWSSILTLLRLLVVVGRRARYLIYRRTLKREQRFRSILDEFSPDLRGRLMLHCYGPAISCVPFFCPSLEGYSGQELMDVTMETNTFAQMVCGG